MEKDQNFVRKEPVHSQKLRAGRKRTYFFDVRPTRSEDYYLTITESKRKFNENRYERHKIFIYKEDFNKFIDTLTQTVNHIKEELMPDYDFDEFHRNKEQRQAERLASDSENSESDSGTSFNAGTPAEKTSESKSSDESDSSKSEVKASKTVEVNSSDDDDDLKW